jgi:putative transposon-encoded protein
MNPAKIIERPSDKKSDSAFKVKFEVYGEEIVEKVVKPSGNSGRVYLPQDWIGYSVKIVKTD